MKGHVRLGSIHLLVNDDTGKKKHPSTYPIFRMNPSHRPFSPAGLQEGSKQEKGVEGKGCRQKFII